MYDGSATEGTLFADSILTKAGALSIRSDSRGNNHHYSEGVSHLLTPIKVQKGCPLSLGDRLSPKTLYRGFSIRNSKRAL